MFVHSRQPKSNLRQNIQFQMRVSQEKREKVIVCKPFWNSGQILPSGCQIYKNFGRTFYIWSELTKSQF